jgi:arylsulfatase A-like enzyme
MNTARSPRLVRIGCWLAAVIVTLACPASAVCADTKPNFIFILADDLGWGDLGCYGHPNIRTPNIDGLAKQGTLFTQFYVNGSVCSPSRTAFMTSHYPARHGIHGHFAEHSINANRGMPDWLDPKVTTLPRLLKDAGYVTAHFGKWHLGNGEGAPTPGAYGFDDHRTVNSNGPGWSEPDVNFRAKSSAAIVDETIRFIKANPGKPFYVNVWSLVPHATLNPTPEQMKPYEAFRPGGGSPHHGALQIFYAAVTDLDTEVGRLLKALDELGVAQNTAVFFSSDNGPEDIHIVNASHSGVGSAGPFRGRKRSLYEGGVRVPWIVRWPGHFPAGKINTNSVVTAVDFLPTVCKVAGLGLPAGLGPDGEDVSDILLGSSRSRSKPIFWEWRFRIAGEVFHQSPMLAMRDGDWKLLMNPDRSRVELYDIPRDPTQLSNLASSRPDAVERMARDLLAWQKTLVNGPVEPAAGRNDYRWPGTFTGQTPGPATKGGRKGKK